MFSSVYNSFSDGQKVKAGVVHLLYDWNSNISWNQENLIMKQITKKHVIFVCYYLWSEEEEENKEEQANRLLYLTQVDY